MKKWLSLIPLFALVVFSLSFESCNMARMTDKSSLKALKKAEAAAPYDVVIVPGVPFGDSSTSLVMKMRLVWAKHLYDHGIAKNIIFSGSSVYSPYVEGKYMKIYADSMGIPSEHTFAETRAEHSTENVYYSWRMARKLGFRRIALATDPFQSLMLKGFIRKHCPDIERIPAVFAIIEKEVKDTNLPKIDPRGAYVDEFVSIKEREGFWERFRGTRGQKIKFEDEKSAAADGIPAIHRDSDSDN